MESVNSCETTKGLSQLKLPQRLEGVDCSSISEGMNSLPGEELSVDDAVAARQGLQSFIINDGHGFS